MTLKILSPNFWNDQAIPKRFAGDGEDVSPPLSWSGIPAEATELALICDDPDAPRADPWVHWVIYNLPPDLTGLPQGIALIPTLKEPVPALQGKNSWGSMGYRGPAPPPGHGVHPYHFKLYALDKALKVPAELTKEKLIARMANHIIARGELVGTYQR